MRTGGQITGVIGRIWDEGVTAEADGDYRVCVLLVILPGKNPYQFTFLRLRHAPKQFCVGEEIHIQSDRSWILTDLNEVHMLQKMGPTFTEYAEPGRISAGG